MNAIQLKRILAHVPDDTLIVRGDNSGGHEGLYDVRQEEIFDRQEPDKKIKALIIE